MQAAGDLGVSRVVYASSEMATGLLTEGTAPTQIPFDETERHPSPNAYALSKYISEVIADSLAVRYPQTAWVGLRINNVIPPDNYDKFSDEWEDPDRGKGNYGATSTRATSAPPTWQRWKGRATVTRCVSSQPPIPGRSAGLRELMAEFSTGTTASRAITRIRGRPSTAPR